MCGLLAFVSAAAGGDASGSSGTALDTADAVARASHLMRHRGPDEPGTWADPAGTVVFGFNRLSIIDIEHSHQPLRWGPPESPGRYELVFNGEIYNYLELRAELAERHGAVFATDGDGEAIVAAYHYWGADALTRLRGMFAFALWDNVAGELFCARDPFGIKPLFMATGTGGTAVASEKKCLLELADLIGIRHRNRRARCAALHGAAVCARTRDPAPRRAPARVGLLCADSSRHGRTGDHSLLRAALRHATPITRDTEQARYDEITAVLEDSVAKHMRADVTVGAFLSGGIDSTAIAALAIRHNPRLITFTTGFEREGFSEIDVAVASAEAIGARHVAKVVAPDEFVAALPEIVWYLDEPVADPALVPLFFVAREARKHVKVVLSGEGADELFGGYTIYREPLSLKPFDYLPGPLRRSMGTLSKPLPEGMRGKSLLHRGSLTLQQRYYGNARSFSDAQLRDVLPGFRDRLDAHRRDGTAVRRISGLGPGGAHAAHRPVHLVARRHSGQGRQDDDGQLAGTAGAVSGSRGVRGRIPIAGAGQDHPHHHEIRAAARAGAHRSAACAQPAETGLPGAYPALAAGRPAAGVGA